MHNATVNESSDSDERRERLDNATNTSLSLRKQAQAVKLLQRIENDLNATGIRFLQIMRRAQSPIISLRVPCHEVALSISHWFNLLGPDRGPPITPLVSGRHTHFLRPHPVPKVCVCCQGEKHKPRPTVRFAPTVSSTPRVPDEPGVHEQTNINSMPPRYCLWWILASQPRMQPKHEVNMFVSPRKFIRDQLHQLSERLHHNIDLLLSFQQFNETERSEVRDDIIDIKDTRKQLIALEKQLDDLGSVADDVPLMQFESENEF